MLDTKTCQLVYDNAKPIHSAKQTNKTKNESRRNSLNANLLQPKSLRPAGTAQSKPGGDRGLKTLRPAGRTFHPAPHVLSCWDASARRPGLAVICGLKPSKEHQGV